MSGRDALIAHLRRDLDMLPGLPDSMSRTMHTACLKTIRRLLANGWIDPSEAVRLSHQVRDMQRNRQPSRCGFEHHSKET